MIIRLVNRGSEGELLLEGSLDIYTTPETEQILAQVSQQFDKVILNLALLENVTPASLRAFKKLHMDMRKKEGSLLLRSIPASVMEVLEVTGYAGLLNIESAGT